MFRFQGKKFLIEHRLDEARKEYLDVRRIRKNRHVLGFSGLGVRVALERLKLGVPVDSLVEELFEAIEDGY